MWLYADHHLLFKFIFMEPTSLSNWISVTHYAVVFFFSVEEIKWYTYNAFVFLNWFQRPHSEICCDHLVSFNINVSNSVLSYAIMFLLVDWLRSSMVSVFESNVKTLLMLKQDGQMGFYQVTPDNCKWYFWKRYVTECSQIQYWLKYWKWPKDRKVNENWFHLAEKCLSC